ncbi:peptidoglycan-binding protein [Bosea sp. 2RAB26]|uniref:peptidoglycan-binding protein n=1 Tax=Bosea sp. 2RAB26 TaxID=3237476 RepID=UPI003F8F18FC
MDTTAIQRALVALGYAVTVDGVPGPKTKTAIQAFQRGRGLAADGVVGPQTIKALQAAVAQRTEPKAAPAAPSLPGFGQPRAPRRVDEIIIHCTTTPEGRPVSVETIRGWHKAQGWKDIGYHWVVLLAGTVAPGRPEAEIGSHVAGHNIGTLGVVYVGGLAAD